MNLNLNKKINEKLEKTKKLANNNNNNIHANNYTSNPKIIQKTTIRGNDDNNSNPILKKAEIEENNKASFQLESKDLVDFFYFTNELSNNMSENSKQLSNDLEKILKDNS